MPKKYLQTIYGTSIKPLSVNDTANLDYVFVEAHPDEVGKSFVTHIDIKGILGGAEAVDFFIKNGCPPDNIKEIPVKVEEPPMENVALVNQEADKPKEPKKEPVKMSPQKPAKKRGRGRPRKDKK